MTAWTIHRTHSPATTIVTQIASAGENAPSAAKKANRTITARARTQNVSRSVSRMCGKNPTSRVSDFVPIVASATEGTVPSVATSEPVESRADGRGELVDVLLAERQRRRDGDAAQQRPHEHARLAGARGDLAD